MLTAICRNDGKKDYWFYEDYINDVMDSIVYVVSDDARAGYHKPVDGDKVDNRDMPQDSEVYLDDNEFYVVKYYGSGNNVDVGLTKDQIISNVLDNKYANGAEYWTFGQMLKTTNDWIESGFNLE